MRLIKIGLVNLNTTVGAVKTNVQKILAYLNQLDKEQVTIGCFQEQVINGYPAEDWVQWPDFIASQATALVEIAQASKDFANLLLITLGVTIRLDGNLYNCQAVISRGKIIGLVPKEKLPTYDVFYEGRTFMPGLPYQESEITLGNEPIKFGDLIFNLPFVCLAVEVCEDIWTPDGPLKRRAYSGAELIINASASPFRTGVVNTRKEMLATRSADNQATIVYVNQYGGNDSLVFDGGGYIFQNGRCLLEAPRWQEGCTTHIIDLDITTSQRQKNTTWRLDQKEFLKDNRPVIKIQLTSVLPEPSEFPKPAGQNFFLPAGSRKQDSAEEYFEDLISAMLTGLDGYYAKTKAFKGLGIALSGGKDSALTLMIAWLYRQKLYQNPGQAQKELIAQNGRPEDFIQCFSMPTTFNSSLTQEISRLLCQDLGVKLTKISIQEAFEREIVATKSMLGLDSKAELDKITLQNIQARIRGQRMLNWANASKGMWLQTGNMSEKAVGYTTVGGDMMGAYSLISNLPKTVVVKLLEYLYQKYCFDSLKTLLDTKASAELAENQEDEKDLMPFPILDACIYLYVAQKMNASQMFQSLLSMWTMTEFKAMNPAFTEDLLKDWINKFIDLFHRSIFKWVLTPEGVHLGSLELDRERALQLPVATSKQWQKE